MGAADDRLLDCRKLLQAPELRQTKDGQTITIAYVRAREVGRTSTEVWQVHAHDRAAQVALMRMNAGDFVALQGVPNTRTASVRGEPVVQPGGFNWCRRAGRRHPQVGGDRQ